MIRARLIVCLAFAAVYAAYVLALGGLRFPQTGDDAHFWRTALECFSSSPVPSTTALRSYNELSTPLPFVLWGELEYWFHQGVWLPRAINIILSYAIVALIAWPPGSLSTRRVAAAAGVLLCPYFLFVSPRLYTDMPALFFIACGLQAYAGRRHAWSALCFGLAIATRQYAVAFPAAIVAYELTRPAGRRSMPAIAAASAAAASLAGWIAIFHGLAPPAAIEAQGLVTARFAAVIPQNPLYLLACVGLYFALPAQLLPGSRPARPSAQLLVVAAALIVLFLLFPPLGNQGVPTERMGLLDRTVHAAGLPGAARVAVFGAFAVAAVWSVWNHPLALAVLAANALVMLKAHVAWDKYALPSLVALWFLTSRAAACDSTSRDAGRGGDLAGRAGGAPPVEPDEV